MCVVNLTILLKKSNCAAAISVCLLRRLHVASSDYSVERGEDGERDKWQMLSELRTAYKNAARTGIIYLLISSIRKVNNAT